MEPKILALDIGTQSARTAVVSPAGEIFGIAEDLDSPLRVIARVLGWPFKWLGYKGDPNQPPVTRALTALGPAYIKFGQILSTRPDVVGQDLADQLRVLQDQLPPFPRAVAMREVERELGR